MRGQRHDSEHPVDPFIRHGLVEQVAVGADENPARLAPAQRLVNPVIIKPDLAGEFRLARRVQARAWRGWGGFSGALQTRVAA